MPHTARVKGRARGTRLAMVAVGLLTVVLGAGIGQAAGASPVAAAATSSTVAPPAGTTTTTAPTASTTTTTGPAVPTSSVSTVPGATTTTTTIKLPVFKDVAAPPHAVVVAADPKKVALAVHLAQLIAVQSATIDKLAVTFSQAQSAADVAAQVTTAVMSKLDATRVLEIAAEADSAAARRALRSAAINAYLGIRPTPITNGPFGPVYQAGLAHAYSTNVVGTVSDRVQAYRTAERRAATLRRAVEDDTRRARTAQARADAIVASAQAASQAATAVQATLSATLATVQSELIALVAAQHAGIAWETYAKLGGGQALDFVPPKPLPKLVPQIAAGIAMVTAQMGKPYLWGGTGPDSFDCSGLMQWSFNQLGLHLPRVAADQQAWAVPVPISQVLPGDLVFFGSPAHHVGLYVGNGLMVDAPHTGGFVETVPIWWDELSGFGRIHTAP